MCGCVMSLFLAWGKVIRQVWECDKCPKHSSYTCVLSRFRLCLSVISVLIVIYLILIFLCISGEKGSILRLCEDMKKDIGGPSLNVATLKSYDV